MNAKSLGIVSLGVISWMGTLWAEPVVWKGGADTSWNTAANWEPATVPNASGAEVDLSAASGTINIASAVTVGNLAFSPASARSLTITGAKLTFAATGGVPTVTVGAGGKLLPTCIVGGTQGLKKYGAGEFNPKAYNAASGMLAGTHEVVEGVVAPVFNAADGYPGNPIQVDAGATLRQTHSDMYGSWQDVFVHGGTYDVGAYCDYINEIVVRDGGRVTGTGFLVQDCMTTPRLLAQGDGFAGLFDVNLRINSCFLDARYHVDGVRTQQVEVANAGATLATTRNIYENRGSAVVNNDLWMREWRSNAEKGWKYGSALEKTGAGDWLLFDSNVTVTGPTTVKGGRLVLSNKVSMAATKVVADTADKLVVKSGATVTVGGLEIASGDLDLGGNVVRIGGPNPAVDAFFGGRFENGTVVKCGTSRQTLAHGQTQKDWDVYGGTLGFGLPAPLVRYDFDSAETLGTDRGVLARHLTVMNQNVSWSPDGVRGGCAKLSGGYLQGADAAGFPSGNAAFTVALWIRAKAGVGGKQALFGWGEFGKGSRCSGFNYEVPKLQHTCWEGANDITSGDLGELRGAWHHVALTFDPATGTRTFYLDGAPVASQTLAMNRSFDLAKPFVIGGGILYSSVFTGEMDEVMLFDRTLSQAQVAALCGAANSASRVTAFGADGTVRIARGATLAMSGVDQTVGSVVGAGTLALDDAVVTVDGTGANTLGTVTGCGTLVKAGAGSLALENATTSGGTVDLKGGTLALRGACTDAALRSHLVAWWDFDDPANPGRDASGNGLTVGPVQQTDNNILHDAWDWRNHFLTLGGAAYFDGTDKHYLVLADGAKHAKIPSGAASFSIALWVKPMSDCAANGTFVYWGANPGASRTCNGFRFNGGELRHYFWSTDCSSSPLPSGFKTGDEFAGWHHVALTYDGTTKARKFYVDGQDWGGEAASGSINVTAANFMIGYGIGSSCYKGYMDDVMIFDTALTAGQVKAIARGFADAPVAGASLTAAAVTTLNVTDGTVGLGDVASAGATAVAAGAKLVLTGEGRLGALSGDGTLDVAAGATLDLTAGVSQSIGELTLAEGAALKTVAADAVTTPTLVVAGAVQLPATATIKLAVSGEEGVTVPLFKAEKGLTGSVEGWEVALTGGKPSWVASAFVRDDIVYVRAHGRGLTIIIR